MFEQRPTGDTEIDDIGTDGPEGPSGDLEDANVAKQIERAREKLHKETGLLVKQGMDAIAASDDRHAYNSLLEATKLDQDNAQAWLWLSIVAQNLTNQKIAIENVLVIDPTNEFAKHALSMVSAGSTYEKVSQSLKDSLLDITLEVESAPIDTLPTNPVPAPLTDALVPPGLDNEKDPPLPNPAEVENPTQVSKTIQSAKGWLNKIANRVLPGRHSQPIATPVPSPAERPSSAAATKTTAATPTEAVKGGPRKVETTTYGLPKKSLTSFDDASFQELISEALERDALPELRIKAQTELIALRAWIKKLYLEDKETDAEALVPIKLILESRAKLLDEQVKNLEKKAQDLAEGETLNQIAQELFGDRDFETLDTSEKSIVEKFANLQAQIKELKKQKTDVATPSFPGGRQYLGMVLNHLRSRGDQEDGKGVLGKTYDFLTKDDWGRPKPGTNNENNIPTKDVMKLGTGAHSFLSRLNLSTSQLETELGYRVTMPERYTKDLAVAVDALVKVLGNPSEILSPEEVAAMAIHRFTKESVNFALAETAKSMQLDQFALKGRIKEKLENIVKRHS